MHDARHTAATVLILLEVSSRIVMDQMGWSSPQMIERYGHVTDRMRRALADRIDGFLSTLTEGPSEEGQAAT
nr:tyrosine-type recombinase/integrase [Catenulispora acidiphila]